MSTVPSLAASPAGEPRIDPLPGAAARAADATDATDATDAADAAGDRRGVRATVLAAVTAVALVGFALYAAFVASRAEDIGEAQPIAVPGGGGAGSAYGAGHRAPDFPLTSLDGQTGRLSDFAGRPVWVNVWATWCAPCRAEMPDVSTVYQEERARETLAASARGEAPEAGGAARGLALLLVSIGEPPDVVRRYLATTKYALPAYVDPSFAITERVRISGLPTHYFIGRDGVIRDVAIGGLKPNGMRARLARILAE